MVGGNFNRIAALVQLLSIGGTFAHPGGMPRLMGRNGFVELRDLKSFDKLVKRVVSPDGTCGGTNGYTCGITTNKCCSQYGWCGDSDGHCLPANGCDTNFGVCTGTVITPPATTPPAPPATPPAAPTTTATTATPPVIVPPPVIAPKDGRCGVEYGNAICSAGQCCSTSGWCGSTSDYCISPGCQLDFGTCDADITPAGPNTSDVPRPKVGSVPYNNIYQCTVPGEIALTYDDGPWVYTDSMINVLDSYNAKATFFVTGVNNGKGAIDTTPAWNTVVKKMYAGGHQLASHTWSHEDLSTLSEARRRDQMYKLEMALRNILGFFPTYMRPPYSSCSTACMATMAELGYHVTFFDVDTDDYNNDSPLLIQNAKNNFLTKIAPSNPVKDAFLVIGHDIHQQTAYNLTTFMLDTLTAKGYKAVTVGRCLGDPVANWYRFPGALTPTVTPIPTPTPTPTPTLTPTLTPTPAPTNTCTYKVSTWCGAPLPVYNTVASCWASIDSCYEQGSLCWDTVAWPASEPCGEYQSTICEVQSGVCQECADSAGGVGTAPCAYKAPVYPAS